MNKKEYKPLPEPTQPGYNLGLVIRELSKARSDFFRDMVDAAVVLKVDAENAAVVFADDPLAEFKLRTLLTVRGSRPFPLGLPVGFVAWTRGRAGEDDAAAVRVDVSRTHRNSMLIMAERGSVTGWFALIPMKEYADQCDPALYIHHVFQAAGPELFLGQRREQREIVMVKHKPFRKRADRERTGRQ
jgi:hypothetical protein